MAHGLAICSPFDQHGGSHGGNPFRGQPSQHPFRHLVRRSDVRSLLLGSSLLEAFNPIDGPEVLGQVLLNDPGVGHVEVALVSPVLAPGIAHLRCVGGLEVCWPSVSSNGKQKKSRSISQFDDQFSYTCAIHFCVLLDWEVRKQPSHWYLAWHDLEKSKSIFLPLAPEVP